MTAADGSRYETSVPSSVYSTLLAHGAIPDPFYRDNELDLTARMEQDYSYETVFTLSLRELEADSLLLHFDGIDTLADIYLNGEHVGSAENMHRVWEYDITELIRALGAGDETAEYTLRVDLHSPLKYIREENEKCYAGGSPDAMEGYPHIRKAACMFGWDWGPRLPDAGLFRTVSILAVKQARIRQVRTTQQHEVTGKTVRGNVVKSVKICADVQVEWERSLLSDDTVRFAFLLTAPDGRSFTAESQQLDALSAAQAGMNALSTAQAGTEARSSAKAGARPDAGWLSASITIPEPQLWWPNGYGSQPLYTAEILLLDVQNGAELDRYTCRLGLRTVTVNTDPRPEEGCGASEKFDPHLSGQKTDDLPGRNFAFEVNGLQIFAMGADYIPEDSLFTRQSAARTEKLLRSAAEAHMNNIRIWGGGYFPDDCFYDLCDELGLLVWQDFLFACACYELDDAFEANFSQEIRDNVRRLRHHACLAVWCGNNEMEAQMLDRSWKPSQKQFYDYIKMFEYIIPKILQDEDPDRFYWPSSPSSGGNYLEPQAENVGDVHYWGVWHGEEPFTAYRHHHYRFLSEFGFQSFPCAATVNSFTAPEDRNVYSRVMEMHQRNTAANGKIMKYLSQTFRMPKNFEELLYCSQLLQAEAIRYGVEHFRRFRGTCMGTVVWQLNDIWPVASWSGIDYYGRWKALQYAEKRMFEPIHISCEEHGEIDQKPFPNSQPQAVDFSVDLHVANETAEPVTGTVRWALRGPDSEIVCNAAEGSMAAEDSSAAANGDSGVKGSSAASGEFTLTVPSYGGAWAPHIDLNGLLGSGAGCASASAADVCRQLRLHLTFAFVKDGQVISQGDCLFCAPKHYAFADPELTLSEKQTEDGTFLTVTAKNFARAVAIESEDGELRLEDNYFDMEKGSRTVRVTGSRPEGKLRVRSLYESAETGADAGK